MSSPSFVGILYNQVVIDSVPNILPPVQERESIRQQQLDAAALSTAVAERENAQELLDLFRHELNLKEQVGGLQSMILRNSGNRAVRISNASIA